MGDDYLQLVEDCEHRESRMTPWEAGFIASVGERLGRGDCLTDAQAATLDSIWERVTADG